MSPNSVKAPKYVISVMERLTCRGFEAYMVGGCVRDLIMGRRPCDWDVCTSALPLEVMALFPHSRPTGLKHGTVTVISHGSPVEVTTFRSDGEYKDHRRPESVLFIGDLKSDLERRDFTINALALPLTGAIRDCFGGKKDIENRLIRCVGEPERRFEEDALRMLRAFRFSAVLGFEIEPDTLAAIRKKSHLSRELARERVRVELEKILLSDSPEVISDIIGYGLLRCITEKASADIDLSSLKRLPKNRALRWAGLCALLLRSDEIDDPEKFLTSLRLDSATLQNCSKACALVSEVLPKDEISWKKLLAANGTETVKCASAAAEVLYGKGYVKLLRSVLRGGDCYSLRQLAVSGDELLELGFRGTELGNALSRLLDYVIEHPSDNNKELLLALAKERGSPENFRLPII
ncbi:MAG: CCA tRNA nucleotidyltransferase [Oscillospiraceae bacterium]